MSGIAGDAAKDLGNWGSVFGIGAAISDTLIGDATQIGVKDIAGESIKIGAVGIGGSVLFTGLDVLMTAAGKKKYFMNPYFVANGFYDIESPNTRRYFKWRKGKKIAGSILSGVGSIAATFTTVNLGGIARHGRSVANTIEHMVAFKNEAKKIPHSKFFQDIVDVMFKCKLIKLVSRGGALTADSIPGCAIASAAISGLTGISANIALSRLNNDNLVTITACNLHWRAFQEMQVLSAQRALGPGSGPAMRLVDRLYHGLASENRWFGVQPVDFIREPCGWMVINDKLNLL
ncbi:hypothetical protein GCM10010964_44130 [Caldovatus sediminis]|uniref:Uncharacterized protein n=1 Tax=Caldovatus sediminis TaxID=2041189 RepID=A0A8J2ZG40_9PROT|nr:hypothetical protein [Caldovatus sediminis]GGG52145.1 hypothetical protein GCM10010964_44130 [Caldovatus sediminis]